MGVGGGGKELVTLFLLSVSYNDHLLEPAVRGMGVKSSPFENFLCASVALGGKVKPVVDCLMTLQICADCRATLSGNSFSFPCPRASWKSPADGRFIPFCPIVFVCP